MVTRLCGCPSYAWIIFLPRGSVAAMKFRDLFHMKFEQLLFFLSYSCLFRYFPCTRKWPFRQIPPKPHPSYGRYAHVRKQTCPWQRSFDMTFLRNLVFGHYDHGVSIRIVQHHSQEEEWPYPITSIGIGLTLSSLLQRASAYPFPIRIPFFLTWQLS